MEEKSWKTLWCSSFFLTARGLACDETPLFRNFRTGGLPGTTGIGWILEINISRFFFGWFYLIFLVCDFISRADLSFSTRWAELLRVEHRRRIPKVEHVEPETQCDSSWKRHRFAGWKRHPRILFSGQARLKIENLHQILNFFSKFLSCSLHGKLRFHHQCFPDSRRLWHEADPAHWPRLVVGDAS